MISASIWGFVHGVVGVSVDGDLVRTYDGFLCASGDHPRIEAVPVSHGGWRRTLDLELDPLFPIARMFLMHTMGHFTRQGHRD